MGKQISGGSSGRKKVKKPSQRGKKKKKGVTKGASRTPKKRKQGVTKRGVSRRGRGGRTNVW